MMKRLLMIFVLLFPSGLLAEGVYNSKSLKTTDYEEIRDILNKYIKNAQSYLSEDGGSDLAVVELKKGLKILLMRPDTDSIRSSLLLMLQNEIIQYRSFLSVLREVANEAIGGIKSKRGKVAHQASLLYILENTMSYLQSINNKESNAILSDINQADLKISKDISNYLLLEMGRGKATSPSYIAGRILKIRLKALKKEQEEKEKADKIAERQKKKRKPSSKRGSKTRPKINLDEDDDT